MGPQVYPHDAELFYVAEDAKACPRRASAGSEKCNMIKNTLRDVFNGMTWKFSPDLTPIIGVTKFSSSALDSALSPLPSLSESELTISIIPCKKKRNITKC